ncbi:Zn-dependent protease with chaperone function [Microbulbifer agarilyticus]|uniref:Zn-dependent protease with chaperone function n=1 Tax=Microbulbifer agarilyticus TaxID=260552 RepID=A0A1Q2M8G2_9GAMM|nr:M48 family metallopeptidase [Microbulbifer agarilyticus]AQQ68512.1 Zn-dependent protease with chaperone function [Microbulbifer agarilyticus]
MNFFEYQDKARRNSGVLIALFCAAVIGLVAITTVFVAFLASYSDLRDPAVDTSLIGIISHLGWETVAGIAITITAIIGLASLFRLRQLAGGGRAVAESLGGRKINTSPEGLAEQRALNVVEEMALASGTPVPDVYILEDSAINAFAAGYSANDAVIGLTRGCIEQLDRDELQGVVAHEFSHIFNGDMRLNIRIVGLLHGILIIGLVGSWLLRGSYWGGRSSRGRMPVFAAGMGLVAIGYTGTFFGNLIKSAVSRQREYLADASAVQFTRNKQGIAGALKKIARHTSGSNLQATNASEFSHMYFASGLRASFGGLFATHPPLDARITRLDPQWQVAASAAGSATPAVSDAAPANISSMHSQHRNSGTDTAQTVTNSPSNPYQATLAEIVEVVDNNIANPSYQQCARGKVLLAEIPSALKAAAHDPFAARALIYGLLIGNEEASEHRATQLDLLAKVAHPAVLREFEKLSEELTRIGTHLRLPLLDLCIPALKSLAPQQFQIFKRNVIKLLRADGKIEIWEWALYRVLMHGLEQDPDRHRKLGARKTSTKVLADAHQFLLATMAHADSSDYLTAKRAFEAGLDLMGMGAVALPARGDMTLQRLDKAVAIARDTPALQKPALLKALAITMSHDGIVGGREVELLRAIADCLDCPMPPLTLSDGRQVPNPAAAMEETA